MSDDPKTPRTPEVVDLDEEPQRKSPVLEDHATPRPSTSPTSSTPSSSPYDKGLKNSELLSSDESVVDSPIAQAGNSIASPITQAGRGNTEDEVVRDNTPTIKADSWEGEISTSPIQADSVKNKAKTPTIQADSREDKELGIPLIDLGEDEVEIVEGVEPVKTSTALKEISRKLIMTSLAGNREEQMIMVPLSEKSEEPDREEEKKE